tara:strand:+ start:931 stop:1110 length:180 start_codon:yes stop_codon:yes gene_type:complete
MCVNVDFSETNAKNGTGNKRKQKLPNAYGGHGREVPQAVVYQIFQNLKVFHVYYCEHDD